MATQSFGGPQENRIKILLDFLSVNFYIHASHPNPSLRAARKRGFCHFNQKIIMAEIGKVYQRNDKSRRQMVPREFFEKDGRQFVKADSCTSQLRLEIPVADIHDGPATWGWSPVKSGGGSSGGEP